MSAPGARPCALLAGAAAGEVSREGLVGEWHFDGDAKDMQKNYDFPRINKNQT